MAFLLFLLLSCAPALGFRFTANQLSTKEERNTDRAQCLRQDNLDLLGIYDKNSEYVFRKVVGVSENLNEDVYLFAKDLLVKQFEGELTWKRQDQDTFKFELRGSRNYKGSENVGFAEVWLSGFEVMTRNTLIGWATSLAANTKVLREGQKGTLYFGLSGTVRAQENAETGQLEIVLVDKKVDQFVFDFKYQAILDKALTKWGGVDELVLDKLFELVKELVPPSMLMAVSYLKWDENLPKSAQDLWLSSSVKLNGSMQKPNGDFVVRAELFGELQVQLADVVQVCMAHLNVTDLATRKVDQFLASKDVQKVWANNREGFLQTLREYRLLSGTGIIELVMNASTLESLRPVLREIAANVSDSFQSAMQPFLNAHLAGKRGYFENFSVTFGGHLGWDKEREKGLYSVDLGPAGVRPSRFNLQDMLLETPAELGQRKSFIQIPQRLLDVFGLLDPLRTYAERDTTMSLDLLNFLLSRNVLQLEKLTVKDLDYAFEDTILRIADAELAPVSLTLPQSWMFPFQVAMESLELQVSPSGDVTAFAKPLGIHLREEEQVPDANYFAGPLRSGNEDALDGKLPAKFARPLAAADPVLRVNWAPAANGSLFLDLKGAADTAGSSTGAESVSAGITAAESEGLGAELLGAAEITISPATIAKMFLNPVLEQDFGYVFYSKKFQSRVSSSTAGEAKSDVVAVVNCGFLRLLQFPLLQEPMDRIQMSDENRIDLTLYSEAPILRMAEGEHCIDLRSSGQPKRTVQVGSWMKKRPEEVDELLCGLPDELENLRQAISLQVARFKDDRAEDWNYGTHPGEKTQYMIPQGQIGTDLLEIVGRGAAPAQRQTPVQKTRSSALQLTAGAADTNISRSRGRFPAARAISNLMNRTGHQAAGAIPNLMKRKAWGKPKLAEGHGGEWSHERKKCNALEKMDSAYFPPDDNPDAAIRCTLVDVPVIGDVHILVDKIQFMNFDLLLTLARIDDRTFSFKISGRDTREAPVNLWLDGIGFKLPFSPIVSTAANIASETEKWASRIFTLGQVRNRGRLDKGPLQLKMYLTGEFEIDEGGHWRVKQGAHSDVNINFGNGGAVQTIINSIIGAYGNMDTIFLEQVYPLLSAFIPEHLGAAFTAVPKVSGMMEHVFRLVGKCKFPGKMGRECPGGEIDFEISDMSTVHMLARPILQHWKDSVQKSEVKGITTITEAVVSNFLKATESGANVLQDSQVMLTAECDYTANTTLTAQAFAAADVSRSALEAAMGKQALLLDILPDDGNALLSGTGELLRRDLNIKEVNIQSLKLPFALGHGEKHEFVGLDAVLRHLHGSLEPKRPSEEALAFQKLDASISLNSSKSSGINLGNAELPLFKFELTPEWMKGMLDEFKRNWTLTDPSRVRTAASNMADGLLPAEFSRAFARMPASLDLHEVISNVTVKSSLSLNGQSDSSGEAMDAGLMVSMHGSLKLGSSFWRALLDSSDEDLGFVHVSAVGSFGQLHDRQPAFLDINCGVLDVYGKSNPESEDPGEVLLHVDIMYLDPSHELAQQTTTRSENKDVCLLLQRKSNLLSEEILYFCSDDQSISKLTTALTLQITRSNTVMESASRAQKADQVAIERLEKQGFSIARQVISEPGIVSRDSTWFRRHNARDPTSWMPRRSPPVRESDVQSPRMRFAEAMEQMKNVVVPGGGWGLW